MQSIYIYIYGVKSSWTVICKVLHNISVWCWQYIYTMGYATTKQCYNEQFLSIKSGFTTNRNVTTNAEQYCRPTKHVSAHDMSGLPVVIIASVIIFVIVCKVQLSVYYLPICNVQKLNKLILY
jgi:hypothetical protein